MDKNVVPFEANDQSRIEHRDQKSANDAADPYQ
jgi:hypothetical protein